MRSFLHLSQTGAPPCCAGPTYFPFFLSFLHFSQTGAHSVLRWAGQFSLFFRHFFTFRKWACEDGVRTQDIQVHRAAHRPLRQADVCASILLLFYLFFVKVAFLGTIFYFFLFCVSFSFFHFVFLFSFPFCVYFSFFHFVFHFSFTKFTNFLKFMIFFQNQ